MRSLIRRGLRKLPRFIEYWREINGDSYGPLSYLGGRGAAPFLIASQWLYVPDFVEYRGGLFRARLPAEFGPPGQDNIDGWFEHFQGDVSGVEKMANLIALWDYIHDDDFHDYVDDLDQLAQTIAWSWQCLLRSEYPDRTFQVDVYSDRDDVGPQITFYSVGFSTVQGSES